MIIPHRLCSFLVNFIPKNFILICCYCQWGLLIGGYLYIRRLLISRAAFEST